MNSTKKGNKLERIILNYFKDEISNNRFFVRKEYCQIYWKKGYYSKDREKEIIFDIAIECYLPGERHYSILILIECKNYSHPVPVDDAEEFYQKILQISGAKGVIVSASSFQEGTITFCKSKKMGLLRYFDPSKLTWELTRSPSSLASHALILNKGVHDGLTLPSFQSDYFDFYGYSNEQYANSINQFLLSLSKTASESELNEPLHTIENKLKTNPITVPRKRKPDIEFLCYKVLKEIKYSYGPVPLDGICALLKKNAGLRVLHKKVRSSKLGKDVLGRITFEPFTITIFPAENEAINKYTIAHELGHFYLGHSKYMSREFCKKNDIELEKPIRIGIPDIMRMEWQANYFASCLLLPLAVFVPDFMRLIAKEGLLNRGFGFLYLDNQQCNLASYFRITDALITKYRVSRKVITIRLKRLGFLQESYGLSRLGHKDLNFTIKPEE
jgi:Zn-dependent peptidase ImmA (M78 family)